MTDAQSTRSSRAYLAWLQMLRPAAKPELMEPPCGMQFRVSKGDLEDGVDR